MGETARARGCAVSVVVPTYREAANIGALIARLEGVRNSSGLDIELVIVDDSSDDGTAEAARAMAKPWARVMERAGARDLSKSALLGVEKARHPIVVVMDADLSHAPEDVPRLVEALAKGAEFVVGSRYVAGGSTDAKWGIGRRIASRSAAAAARLVCPARDPLSGFLCFRREWALGSGDLRPRGYKIGLELMARRSVGAVAEVPIHFEERRAGRSKLGMRQAWQFVVQLALLGNSVRWWGARLAAAVLLACLVGAVYGRAAGYGLLQWDDRFHFAENAALVSSWPEGLVWFWRQPHGNL
jgi:dolichol-phosphate mannosyltransferase